MTDELSEALRRHFGYTAFRPLQREIIEHLRGGDALALMPTGGGKSLCYQLPALAGEGCTLVVSPLIALMHDQVQALRAHGAPAACLHSGLDPAEQREVERQLLRGALKLLYVAPERVNTPRFAALIERARPRRIAIDEAHCISQWGHEFRPDYRELRRLTERLADASVLALTATATRAVAHDIVEQLGRRDMKVFRGGYDRPNLTYRVLPKQRAKERLAARLARDPELPTIVYCLRRADAENTAQALRAAGFAAAFYHAGLDADARRRAQDAFIRDETPIICATVAFGMGIDKPDVRRVAHMDMPASIEAYYQETGRAGRDGDPAECLLFFTRGAWRDRRFHIDRLEDEEERRRAFRRLGLMMDYCQLTACRRSLLLRYFGERPPSANCGACDNCLGEDHARDAPPPRRASRAARASRALRAATGDSAAAGAAAASEAALAPDAARRFEALRQARRALAQRHGVPAYVVAHDRTLRAAARANPRSPQELEQVEGFGPAKVARYGAELLAALADDAPASPDDTPPAAAPPTPAAAPTPKTAPAPDAASSPDFAPAPDAAPAPNAVPPRDAAPAPDAALPPDFAPAPDVAPAPNTVPPLNAAPVPDAALSPDFALAPDVAPAPEAALAPEVAPAADAELAPEAARRFEALRQARRALAQRHGVPAYVVAHDRALRAAARANPRSPQALEQVAGFGPTKVARYGAELLAALADDAPPAE